MYFLKKNSVGQISITLDSDWKEPKTQSAADITAAQTAMQFKLGWYAHPIFVNGDYPEEMKQKVHEKSMKQGLNVSRLPAFTEAEKSRISGKYKIQYIHLFPVLKL